MLRVKMVSALIFVIIFMHALLINGQDRPLPVEQERERKLPYLRSQEEPDILYLTPEQENEVLEYIKETQPEQLDEVSILKQKRPERYKRLISRAYREMRFLKELQDRDPDRHKRILNEKKLERDSRKLAKQYRLKENEEEKLRIKEELENLLYKLFDLRQMNRMGEIEKLEKKLTELKEINKKRLDNKDTIVQMRLKKMLGEYKGLEW